MVEISIFDYLKIYWYFCLSLIFGHKYKLMWSKFLYSIIRKFPSIYLFVCRLTLVLNKNRCGLSVVIRIFLYNTCRLIWGNQKVEPLVFEYFYLFVILVLTTKLLYSYPTFFIYQITIIYIIHIYILKINRHYSILRTTFSYIHH